MKKFILNNYRWIVSTVIAIIGIAIPVVNFFNTHENKALGYFSPTVSALVFESKNDFSIEVSHKGSVLESPFLSILKIKNIGALPIAKSDFDGSIKIRVINEAKIVTVKLSQTEPKSLPVNIEYSDEAIQLAPLLLNPEDEVSLEVITHSVKPEYDLSARVYGIKELTRIEDVELKQDKAYLIFLMMVAVFYGVAFSIASFSSQIKLNKKAEMYLMFLLVMPVSISLSKLTDQLLWSFEVWVGLVVIVMVLGHFLAKMLLNLGCDSLVKEKESDSLS